jgi:transposase-like protein
MCVERMKQCDDIVALAAELDIHRRLLYRWRDQLDPVDKGEWPPPQNSRESTLRKEVSQLKRVLADKTVELNFFKGALQKVEARRQQSDDSGGKASTTNPGSDVLARQLEYRADVSTGPGESRRLLQIVAGA